MIVPVCFMSRELLASVQAAGLRLPPNSPNFERLCLAVCADDTAGVSGRNGLLGGDRLATGGGGVCDPLRLGKEPPRFGQPTHPM